jgi:hypothetical protein
MREKVEREGPGGWKGESSRANRQGYVHRLDKVATSYYFTNIPDEVKAVDLWPRFAKFGRVGEVFIPAKVDKQGKRFGFVKFRDVHDDRDLLRRISNIWIDSFKLRINLSKFSRRVDGSNKDEDRRREEPKLGMNHGGGQTQPGKSFVAALVEKEGVGRGPTGVVTNTLAEGDGGNRNRRTPGVVTNTLVEDESGGRIVTKDRGEVVWEVEVEEDRLSKLEGAYVGFLVEDKDAQSIQNNFCMDGFSNLQVCEMGYRKILLWSEKTEVVKEVLGTVGWWCSLFEKVVPWSPELVSSERVAWLKCYGVPQHAWGVDLFRALAFKYGRFIEVDETTHQFKRCDYARVKVLTNESSAIDSVMAIKVLGRRFDIRVMEEIGRTFSLFTPGSKKDEGWAEETSSRASGEGQSVHALVEGISESGSDADVSESCHALLEVEAHGRGRMVTSGSGKEIVQVGGEMAEIFPNNLGNPLVLSTTLVNFDGDIRGGEVAGSEETNGMWEDVQGEEKNGTTSAEVSPSSGDKELERFSDIGPAHQPIICGPFVNYVGMGGGGGGL